MLDMIGRLRAGVSIEQARAEAVALAASLAAANSKTNRLTSATVVHSWEEHNGVNEYLRAPLVILLTVSFVVLLIVCVNVANLLLARSVGRQREFGIRFALGASRGRVALQMLTETLVLSAAGAGVGLLILLWMQGSLIAMVPSIGFPLSTSFVLNARLLGFTALACVLAALISGASPALFVFHSSLNEVLKEGSRSDTAGAASRRTRSALVIGEVALATVALVGAGLFVRSFRNVRSVNPVSIRPTFSSRPLLHRDHGLHGSRSSSFPYGSRGGMLTAPGIEAAAYTDFVPLSTTAAPGISSGVEGYTPAKDDPDLEPRPGIARLLHDDADCPGRRPRFQRARRSQARSPVIVNQAFVQRYFHGTKSLGREGARLGEVVHCGGVARESKYYSPASAPSLFLQAISPVLRWQPELLFRRGSGDPVAAIRCSAAW